jgi:hypothetical protein
LLFPGTHFEKLAPFGKTNSLANNQDFPPLGEGILGEEIIDYLPDG